MSKSNVTENDLVKFIFNNVAMPSYGSNLYLALHTGDPGEGGVQTSSECAYTNYTRILVSRDNAGWTVSGNQAVNTALVQFPQSASGPETATHFSVGTAFSGDGQILYSGILSASLVINNLVQPQFAAGSLVIQED